jgi:DNA-binding response OmpR family regulator
MNVLVVEDDRALGLFLQKGLKLEGHDVDWVGDGEAAIERAERGVPDLVVLDLSQASAHFGDCADRAQQGGRPHSLPQSRRR